MVLEPACPLREDVPFWLPVAERDARSFASSFAEQMKGTIKSKGEIDFLFKNGEKVNTKTLIIIAGKNEQRGRFGRVAFVAGKKIGNAPTRNYAKRLLRHAARDVKLPQDGMDIILVAKKRLVGTRFDLIVEDLRAAILKLDTIFEYADR